MTGQKISTKEVLTILGVLGVVVVSVVIPGLPVALGSVVKIWQRANKKDLGRIIKRLEKQQMLLIKEDGDKISIELTEKGKHRILQYDYEGIELKSRRRDGKWHLIIFDIPEVKKRNRDAFRKKLLQIGCQRLQDSVFVCAFPCKNEIDFLCNYLDVSDYVTVVTLDKFERGEKLIFKSVLWSE